NPGRPIPFRIQQLTGITSRDVANAPTLREVVRPLLRFVGDYPIVGHYIGFDLAFLRAQRLLTRNVGIDTFELASILLPDQPRYSLSKLAERFNLELKDAHRALDDARASAELFNALLKYGSQLPIAVLTEINRLATHSNWPLREVFLEMERRASRHAFIHHATHHPSSEPEDSLFADLPVGDLYRQPPLHPRDNPEPLDTEELAQMLEEHGAFSQAFPGFEYRPPQIEMLRAVTEAFNNAQHLMVEAGTGTGKSLAYLLPAVHYAVKNGTRVVISTNTINLQDQLYNKDIPDLKRALAQTGDPAAGFRAALLKGRSNYLCPRRFAALAARDDLSPEEISVLARILVWLPRTKTGDRAELFLPSAQQQAIWNRVATDQEMCTMEHCPYERKGRCFFYQARRQAERAHVVVINHALLLSDIATERRVLPEYRHLIIDEAHHLEEATTRQLGFEADRNHLAMLLTEIHPRGGGHGLLADLRAALHFLPKEIRALLEDYTRRLEREAEQCYLRLDEFFDTLRAFLDVHLPQQQSLYDQRLRLTYALRTQPAWANVEMAWDNVARRLHLLGEGLLRLRQSLTEAQGIDLSRLEEVLEDIGGAGNRLLTAYQQMHALIAEPSDNGIYWIQVNPRTDHITLHAVPLYVGPLVREHILYPNDTVIMTSATLTTAGSFDYIQERLEAQEMETLSVGSPFDFESAVLLYLPTDMPEPNHPTYQTAVERTLAALAQATEGRLLALFTSYRQLYRTAEAIGPQLMEQGITVYQQGDSGSRQQLLENFRTTERAVLFGTRSFWEGVDVVGEALSCLAIVRLPFDVPFDPIFAARAE
ncbi:MAG TPA: DEAD/DEAH box helicase, partial [Anaerolineae bacterium]|nr:DEAD/DEAH box helicase [Anaerolineae bacterium]